VSAHVRWPRIRHWHASRIEQAGKKCETSGPIQSKTLVVRDGSLELGLSSKNFHVHMGNLGLDKLFDHSDQKFSNIQNRMN
jgi:hypothetical protein